MHLLYKGLDGIVHANVDVSISPIHALPVCAELGFEVLVASTSLTGRDTFHAHFSLLEESTVLFINGKIDIGHRTYVGTGACFRFRYLFGCTCGVELNDLVAELVHPVQHMVRVFIGEVSLVSHSHKGSHNY